MTMTGVKLFQLLKSKMGDREADALITYMDDSLHDNKKEFHAMMLSTFATKSELKEEAGKFRVEIGGLREDLAKIEGSLREDLAKVEGRLETKISDVKSDVLRWMFAFFVTMILAILGLYLKK